MAPLPLSLFLLPLTVSGWALPSYGYGRSNYYGLRQGKCEATTGPSPDAIVDSYLPISRADNVTSRSSIFFDNIRRGVDPSSGSSRLARRQVGDLSSALGGAEYLIDIQFQDQWHKAILDTGSSDTWLIQDGFQCTDSQGQNVDRSQCGFGAPYTGGYIWQAQDQNFQIVYGDGEYVQGSTGWADITVGGITVKNTQVSFHEILPCVKA
jgi:aspergillopepsin I